MARQVTGKPTFDVGKQYAVIIGIDRYKEWPILKSAVSEAKAIKRALADRYYIDRFFELYDEDASAVGIRKLFTETLPGIIGIHDSLLVFYAGHGQLDASKTGFWIACDGSADQLSQANWLPNAQLRNMIGGLKAQRILILADACFSGDFLNVKRGAMPTVDSAYYRQALQLVARQVLTSGASQEVPDDSEFGKQLVSLLERNTDAMLDPIAIYDYVRRGMKDTLPLFGTMSEHQDGASFVLFLRTDTDAASASVSQPGTSATGVADLRVLAENGAEVLVDGESKGLAPLLLKMVDAGRPLRVAVRTASMAGELDVTLKPGELREISVPLHPLSGNLVINADRNDVEVWVDGADRGPLDTGIVKSLPVGARQVELKGNGLYARFVANIAADETIEARASVREVGRIMVDAPAGAKVSVSGAGLSAPDSLVGSGCFDHLPVGDYELTAGGPGFLDARAAIKVEKGCDAAWKPFSSGGVEFAVEPNTAWCSIDGGPPRAAAGVVRDLSTGTHTVVVSKPGYRDFSEPIAVEPGKIAKVGARLGRCASATLRFNDFGVALAVDGGPDAEASPAGLGVSRVNSRVALRLVFASPYAERIDVPALEATFGEGESRAVDIPSGQICLPWIPKDSEVVIGSDSTLTLTNTAVEGFRSRPLPVGVYKVALKGALSYSGTVVVSAGSGSEPDGYKAALAAGLKDVKLGFQTKKAAVASSAGRHLIIGLSGLGLGLAAGAFGTWSYLDGANAYKSYTGSASSDSAASYRSQAELDSYITTGAGALAAVSLAASIIELATKPNASSFDRQIEYLDEQIKALAAAEAPR
jgi:hypothetical protein